MELNLCPKCSYVTVDLCATEALDASERLAEMKRILTEELPTDNYFVLKYIIHFLTEVIFVITSVFNYTVSQKFFLFSSITLSDEDQF